MISYTSKECMIYQLASEISKQKRASDVIPKIRWQKFMSNHLIYSFSSSFCDFRCSIHDLIQQFWSKNITIQHTELFLKKIKGNGATIKTCIYRRPVNAENLDSTKGSLLRFKVNPPTYYCWSLERSCQPCKKVNNVNERDWRKKKICIP